MAGNGGKVDEVGLVRRRERVERKGKYKIVNLDLLRPNHVAGFRKGEQGAGMGESPVIPHMQVSDHAVWIDDGIDELSFASRGMSISFGPESGETRPDWLEAIYNM